MDPAAVRWLHMSDPFTLVATASYDDLRQEVVFTLVRCEPDPLAAGQVPAMTALLPRVDATAAKDAQLDLDVQRAEALAIFRDGRVDKTVDGVVNAILTLTGGDRTAELYKTFLGTLQPAELKAPILDEELDTLENVWIPELESTPHLTLAAFLPDLKQQVADGRAAEKALEKARQALAHHRSAQGDKGQLVDEINAARKVIHGQLGAIAHANPLAMLPDDWADGFFAKGHTGRKLTTGELTARVGSTQKLLTSLQERLTKSQAEDAARVTRKEKRQEAKRQRQLEKASKAAEKANAKVAKLQAAGPAKKKAGDGSDPAKGGGSG